MTTTALTVIEVELAARRLVRGDGALVDAVEQVRLSSHDGRGIEVVLHAPAGTHRIGQQFTMTIDPKA